MATGISKNQWVGKRPLPGGYNGTGGGAIDIHIAYEGKKSEQEILRTAPAQCRLLWPKRSTLPEPNRLYFGENLAVLSALAQDPNIRGQVRLVYIDPPYATRSVFQSRKQTDAYADLLEGAHYLEFLRERLILLRELLANDGSIYVHLDDKMAFHAKAVMDEVFGRANFRNWITRRKCNPKNYTRNAYGNVSDFILFYSKSNDCVWHRPLEVWTEQRALKEYSYTESGTGRRFKKVPIHAPGIRHGETGKPWRGKNPPPGKHWQYPPKTLDAMDARGEIYWSANGNPRRKIYLDSSAGVPVQDIWLDFRDAHNQNIKVSGYPTEKNPDLLSRIIEASSNKGDLVLDCFAGSGTTLATASNLGRRWIGVDNSIEAIRTTLRRLAKGLEAMGDFVGKDDVSAKDDGKDEATLSLFDIATPLGVKKPTAAAHAPITELSLFAQDMRHEELKDTVDEWEGWIAPSIVREASTGYSAKRNRKKRLARRLPQLAGKPASPSTEPSLR